MGPLLAQLLVAIAGVLVALINPFDLWVGTLLVPAVVVVLLTEGWAWFLRRRKERVSVPAHR